MRTIIDLPAEQYDALKKLAERENASPAELVRRALNEYLARHTVTSTDEAFGLWRHRNEAGLSYEDRIRHDWEG
jgi:predicted transcriptional regulator